MQFTKISSKGQMILPARIRKKYKLKAGSVVGVDEQDGKITVIPNPQNPYDEMLALHGIMSHIEEDVEGWWMAEKRKEREREDRE
jgi:AbrB family looped-hinge helix DNA binding protein